MKISHISLGVGDLDRSEKFYRDVLGLPVERNGSDAFVRWPDFLLVLSENPPAGRGKMHFGFRVESKAEVDAWAARLRTSGAQIVAGPATHGETHQLFLLDPDDYEIEIYAES
mgnify:CR=1 FL=1